MEIEDVLKRRERGESYDSIRRATGFRESSVRKWEARARGPAPLTSTPIPAPAPDSDFARALEAIGGDPTPTPEPEVPPTPEAPPAADPFFTPPPESEPELEVKIPTPSELLRIIKAVDWIVMRGVAGAKYPGIPPEVLGPAIRLQPEDEAVLEELAPYAVEYLPEIAKYLKPVMACAFVGVWGLSVVTRTKILAQIHEELRVRKARTVKAETVS